MFSLFSMRCLLDAIRASKSPIETMKFAKISVSAKFNSFEKATAREFAATIRVDRYLNHLIERTL